MLKLLRQLCSFVPDVVGLPRPIRQLLVLSADLAICAFSVWLAFWLRLGEWDWLNWPVFIFMTLAVSTWLAVSLPAGTYRSVLRFSGRHTVFRMLPVFGIMSLILAMILFTLRIPGIPRTISVLHPLLFFFGAATLRISAAQLIWNAIGIRARNRKRVLIYGAGSAGQQLAHSLRREPGMVLVGFIDSNPTLDGRYIEGKPVWHSPELEKILAQEDVSEVFLAMPSASRQSRWEIIERLKPHSPAIRVRVLPSLSQIAFGHVSISDLREVQIEELLGRDEVQPDPQLLAHDIRGKIVLVTGAGGSIGSELARQILRQLPSKLVLADQAEHALYLIDTELQEFKTREALGTLVVADLANVADERDCARLFDLHRPDTVFHAAAYKHVPLVEANRLAGIRNNVIGTFHAALNAERVSAAKFVLVSTDKAVRPTNIMGASKRACELIIQARSAAQKQTSFTAVRFGNVLGSSGSVVPRFRDQIARGGPVTVTHRDVTRFFMTIPEASQLVIQAGAMAEGGEIFLLDMGQPVRIVDLARSMIELSGLAVRDESNTSGDIEIVEVGLRPGEKLFEELLIAGNSTPTDHPRIVRAREEMVAWSALAEFIERLRRKLDDLNVSGAVQIIQELVPGYHQPQTFTAEEPMKLAANG